MALDINQKLLNTLTTTINKDTFGGATGSSGTSAGGTTYQESVSAMRDYDQVLLTALDTVTSFPYSQYALNKSIPARGTDTLNLKRFIGLESNPQQLNLKMSQEGLEGPDLKVFKGVAIEFKLSIWGNGIEINDTLDAYLPTDLFALYGAKLIQNALEVRDNIIAINMYAGASKVFIEKYEVKSDKGNPEIMIPVVTLTSDLTKVKGALNHAVLRSITTQMKSNVESYSVPGDAPTEFNHGSTAGHSTDANHITRRSPILPLIGNKYGVLLPYSGMDQLLSDPIYLKTQVFAKQDSTYTNNWIPSIFRYSFVDVENFLSISFNKAGQSVLETNGTGNIHIAFVIGKEAYATLTYAGQGAKFYTKSFADVDTADKYGRMSFMTYKLFFGAHVINSKAIYAVAFAPNGTTYQGTLQTENGDITAVKGLMPGPVGGPDNTMPLGDDNDIALAEILDPELPITELPKP